jgi:hypothetical protein
MLQTGGRGGHDQPDDLKIGRANSGRSEDRGWLDLTSAAAADAGRRPASCSPWHSSGFVYERREERPMSDMRVVVTDRIEDIRTVAAGREP